MAGDESVTEPSNTKNADAGHHTGLKHRSSGHISEINLA